MNVLVVAFDGMDKELIERFSLESVLQEEFGTIENEKSMNKIVTPELFASFVTGETSEEHGVEVFDYWTNEKIEWLESNLPDSKVFNKFRELRFAIYESVNSLDARRKRYDQEDLKVNSIFEKLEDSRAMFIPGYNPSKFWAYRAENLPFKFDDGIQDSVRFYDSREYEFRKRALFSELENDIISPRNFLMCHFHRVDQFQHYYGDESIGRFDQDKLLDLYRETDELASNIKQKALSAGYDCVIFMSDHGLPTEDQHNKQAFYSSNIELFGDDTPHITDFHDKILELTDN